METAPVKLAIIGAGGAVNWIHVPALQRLVQQFTVTAVCAPTRAHAEHVASRIGAHFVCSDAKAAIVRNDVEAVLIAVPTSLNGQIIELALESGKHVLVEKPLATNVEEGQRLLKASRDHPDLVAMVAANTRHSGLTRALSEVIWNGMIGPPAIACFQSIAHVDLQSQAAWRAKPTHTGGYLLDGGVHAVAALRTLFGEAERITAISEVSDERIGGRSGMSIHARTSRGVQLICTFLTTACPSAENRTTLYVYGEKGSVSVSSVDGQIRLSAVGGHNSSQSAPADAGHTAQLMEFFSAIRSGTTPLLTFEAAYGDMLWIRRALDSASRADVQ